jgi:NAD(P)-dependent dehydrogenase (short-subunit alcohol dehydrogenase family)
MYRYANICSTLGGDRGWIINISSILGLVGMSGASAYAATKGAVLQMTKVHRSYQYAYRSNF